MSNAGQIRAVIFDWAGTTVDFGSMAPVAAFAAAFENAGVPVSDEEIRRPMGQEKRRHITQMLGEERLATRWRRAHGAPATEDDISRLYDAFAAHILDILPRYAEPIPGTLETVAKLRSAGIKIGSNSGYAADLMRVLAQAAQQRGFAPDCIVSASEVAAPRPAPDLSLKCLELLGLDATCAAVKVDDTETGIEEGRNAGLWTVAVAISGNEVGLSLDAWSALEPAEQARLRDRARERLRASKPDYVIDTVADLEAVLDDIEKRIARAETPGAR